MKNDGWSLASAWLCGFGLLFFSPVIGVLWLIVTGVCWLFTSSKKKDPAVGKAIVKSWGPHWRNNKKDSP